MNAKAKLGSGWSRPKRMHQATRDRLVNIIIEAEMFRDELIDASGRRHPGMVR